LMTGLPPEVVEAESSGAEPMSLELQSLLG
jgi:hypothetical protein